MDCNETFSFAFFLLLLLHFFNIDKKILILIYNRFSNCSTIVEGLVHPKMKIVIITHPHVVPNP